MFEHVRDGQDPCELPQTLTGSVLPQEPARRLLHRALELLGVSELELQLVKGLAPDEEQQRCGGDAEHLRQLREELGTRCGVGHAHRSKDATTDRLSGE